MNYELRITKLQKGFTLIELLIVIAIIGVLAALLMSNFIGVRQRARDATRKSDLRQIQAALELYRADNGNYPLSGTGAGTLDTTCGVQFLGTSSDNPMYMRKMPCDPLNDVNSYNGGKYYYFSPDQNTYVLGACLENTNDKDPADTPTSPGGTNPSSCKKFFVLNNP